MKSESKRGNLRIICWILHEYLGGFGGRLLKNEKPGTIVHSQWENKIQDTGPCVPHSSGDALAKQLCVSIYKHHGFLSQSSGNWEIQDQARGKCQITSKACFLLPRWHFLHLHMMEGRWYISIFIFKGTDVIHERRALMMSLLCRRPNSSYYHFGH